MKKTYYSIGLMSGTSLDGLDIALCKFEKNNEIEKNKSSLWNYEIIETKCVEYDKNWKEKLQNAHLLSALALKKLETEWTDFLVKNINKFVLQSDRFDFSALDCISSHGHTIFHQPTHNQEQTGFTFQMGNGAMLAAKTGFDVVSDFRQTDVALGGQGAPLVPIGDELLFSDFDFCLNLGGIANISFSTDRENNNSRFAFDICPCNMVLNFLSNKLGYEYDKGGELAKDGKIDEKLLQGLNNLAFYKENFPKSLGREWVEENIFSIINSQEKEGNTLKEQHIRDLLHTFTYHSAFQIAESIKKIEPTLKNIENQTRKKLLITGGGTHNDLLIAYLESFLPKIQVVRGDEILIAYKEALIFAFLGVLRLRGETNTLASVTGASRNSCGGSVYLSALTSSKPLITG